jgi:hypothetical protein
MTTRENEAVKVFVRLRGGAGAATPLDQGKSAFDERQDHTEHPVEDVLVLEL